MENIWCALFGHKYKTESVRQVGDGAFVFFQVCKRCSHARFHDVINGISTDALQGLE